MAFIPIHDTNPLRNIRRPYAAWGLLIANVLVYFLVERGGFVGEPSHASVAVFGLIPAVFNGYVDPPTMVPDALTLVTYSFLHGDVWHLAGNMIFLWVLADNVEDALGPVRYVVFYLACAGAGGYAYVLTEPTSGVPVIGASGAVAGNIAAYLILHPRAKMWVLAFARIPLRLSAVYVLGFWVAFQLIAAITGGKDGIAWWAHVGGLVAGATLIVLMRKPGVVLFDRRAPDAVAAPAPSLVDNPGPPLAPEHDDAPLPNDPRSRGPWR